MQIRMYSAATKGRSIPTLQDVHQPVYDAVYVLLTMYEALDIIIVFFTIRAINIYYQETLCRYIYKFKLFSISVLCKSSFFIQVVIIKLLCRWRKYIFIFPVQLASLISLNHIRFLRTQSIKHYLLFKSLTCCIRYDFIVSKRTMTINFQLKGKKGLFIADKRVEVKISLF